MKTLEIGTRQEITNFAFSAFIFSTFGWALLEMQLIRNEARPTAHLLVSLIALALVGVSFRRCRLWWPGLSHAGDDGAKPFADRYAPRDLYPCLALLTAGAVLAFFVSAGSVFLLVLMASAIGVVPWARIGFCRKHFFLSWGLLAAGGALVLLAGPKSASPFPYLFGAWVLWFVALMELLVTYKGASRPPIEPAR